jgi:hypothetical protein
MNPALKTPLAGLGLVLAGVIALPTSAVLAFDSSRLEAQSAELIARKGGGGGGGGLKAAGGGGARKAGGGGHSGFSNAGGGLNRGSAKPTGGWSNKAKVGGGGAGGGPSLNRPAAATRPAAGNRAATGARPGGSIGSGDRMASRDKPASRDLGRDGSRDLGRNGSRDLSRDGNRSLSRDVNRNISRDVNRNWNRNVDINRVNLYPGWARPGWGVARPWNYGWYGGWSTPVWGWWGARAAAWGVATLATAAIINDAVDDAVDDHNSYIVVPNTNYQLLYGTVQPSSSDSVTFVVQANGNDYQLNANCNQGTINGQEPSNAEEAELLNAACQVAYGSV